MYLCLITLDALNPSISSIIRCKSSFFGSLSLCILSSVPCPLVVTGGNVVFLEPLISPSSLCLDTLLTKIKELSHSSLSPPFLFTYKERLLVINDKRVTVPKGWEKNWPCEQDWQMGCLRRFVWLKNSDCGKTWQTGWVGSDSVWLRSFCRCGFGWQATFPGLMRKCVSCKEGPVVCRSGWGENLQHLGSPHGRSLPACHQEPECRSPQLCPWNIKGRIFIKTATQIFCKITDTSW